MRSLLILLALCGAGAAPAPARLAGYDISHNRNWGDADTADTSKKCDDCLDAEEALITKLEIVEAAEKANADALAALNKQKAVLVNLQTVQNGKRKTEEDKSKAVGDKIAEIEKDYGADDPSGIMGHTAGLNSLANDWLLALNAADDADKEVNTQEGVVTAAETTQKSKSEAVDKADPSSLVPLQEAAHEKCAAMRKSTVTTASPVMSEVKSSHVKASAPAAKWVMIADGHSPKNQKGCALATSANGSKVIEGSHDFGKVNSLQECESRCDSKSACHFIQYHLSRWCTLYETCPLTRPAEGYDSRARVYKKNY